MLPVVRMEIMTPDVTDHNKHCEIRVPSATTEPHLGAAGRIGTYTPFRVKEEAD